MAFFSFEVLEIKHIELTTVLRLFVFSFKVVVSINLSEFALFYFVIKLNINCPTSGTFASAVWLVF